VPLAVLPLVLVAAVLHATWNALLKASEHPLGLATRAVSLSAAISLPVLAAVWFWQGRPGLMPMAWLVALGSAALELLYFIALSTAYRRGELSVVYPIARGTAPLLALCSWVSGCRWPRLSVSSVCCSASGRYSGRPRRARLWFRH